MRTSFEFVQLARELLQTLPQDMLGLQLMPDDNREHDEYVLLQPRVFAGRVQWRGANQDVRPTRTPFAYENRACIIKPGYWAEYQEIDEFMLRNMARPGTCGGRFDLIDYEAQLMFDAAMKIHQRKESDIWQALVNGYVEERNDSGIVIWSQRYKIIRARFGVSACDRANSTPLADLACIARSVVGTSGAMFDSRAKMYANSRTWECLLRNTNPLDIGRMSLSACCDAVGMQRLAQFFIARGLPSPVVYDGFWIDENKRPNYYIPTGKIVMIGVRPDGRRVGAYFQPPQLLSCGNSTIGGHGAFVVRQDNACPDDRMPWNGRRVIRWTYGLYGIPVIEHPTSVIVVDTGCDACDCGPLVEACPL
jgi:hypothetical protein